jgi:transcriptional antiterminator RfaH
MSTAISKQWFVLTSKSREEQRAFDNLANQGFEVFLPKVSRIKKRQGIKSVALEPLFPSYLFIQLDTNEANFNA